MPQSYQRIDYTMQAVLPEVYEVQYAPYDYARFANMRYIDDPYADSIVNDIEDEEGEAKYMTGHDQNPPVVNITLDSKTRKVWPLADSIHLTPSEVAVFARRGRSLLTRSGIAARRAIERKIYQGVLYGTTDSGRSETTWDGLINNSSITVQTAAQNSGGSSRKWEDKDADEILADLTTAFAKIVEDTNEVYYPNICLIPTKAFNFASSLKRDVGTDMGTLAWWQRNNPYTQATGELMAIMPLLQLKNAGASNAGRMVMYRRDPMLTNIFITKPAGPYPAHEGRMGHVDIDWDARWAGFEERVPKSMVYVDGIQ